MKKNKLNDNDITVVYMLIDKEFRGNKNDKCKKISKR